MSQPIRVMRVIARMNVGGPAMQVAGLAEMLPKSEFEQRIYAGSVAEDEADFVELHDLQTKVELLPGYGRGFSSLADLQTIGYLTRQMQIFRPHIVHSHTAKAGVMARVAATLSGVGPKKVHTYHGHLLSGYFGPSTLAGLLATERFLARKTDVLVTVGSKVRDDLLARGVGKLDQYRLVPPGVREVEAAERKTSREKLGLSQGEFVVLFLGRLTKIKRVDRLLEAVKIVKARVPNLQVLIAGDGDLRHQLQMTSEADDLPVRFLGWQKDLDVLLGASDCLVLTSDNEGTPVSLIQAGMAGVASVATNVGSVNEVINHNVTGLVVEPSPIAVANALVNLADDALLRERLGLKAQQSIGERYSYQRLVADHASIYRELMST